MCDSKPNCDLSEDERDCEYLLSDAISCSVLGATAGSGKTRTVLTKEMCEFPTMTFLDGYCEGYIDQLNCSDSHVFVCSVRSGGVDYLNSKLRRQWVCNGKALCVDGGDEWCHEISDTCLVHKHSLCDDIVDCTGGPDETRYVF